MNPEIITCPIVVRGHTVRPGEGRETLRIKYDSGVEVVLPKVMPEDMEDLKNANRFALHDIHVQEIIGFFLRVGQKFWTPDNANHPLHQAFIRDLTSINGYGVKMAMREANIIHSILTLHTAWHDLLDYELGNRFYMEEWVPLGDALIHAQPVGNVLHFLVGNVPVSGVMSIVRSAVTKNQTIAKIAKRDPITALYFVLSCLEIEPEHPVSKALSAVYWPAGDPLESGMIGLCDAICVWGGHDAVKEIKTKAGPGIEVIEFGPKTSFAVVGRESAGLQRTAVDLAHDVALYDQEACFSPQMAFVEGEVQTFVGHLKESLELYTRLLPKGHTMLDVHAHVSRARLEALYNGNEILATPDTEWTIVVVRDPSEINEHPLSRVIYVIPVKDIRDCIPYINRNSQTITLSPWSRNVEIRDEATLRGATKITEIGLVEAMRVGTTHDGVHPLHRMVRWVCVERGCDYWGKYIQQGPVDTTLWLMLHEKHCENAVI